jgi:hypothetical protein
MTDLRKMTPEELLEKIVPFAMRSAEGQEVLRRLKREAAMTEVASVGANRITPLTASLEQASINANRRLTCRVILRAAQSAEETQ